MTSGTSLVREMWEQPTPREEAVHSMCSYVRKIVATFDKDPNPKDFWIGPCKKCDGWKDYPEEDAKGAQACYIRAEETLKYAMAVLKREGWKEP